MVAQKEPLMGHLKEEMLVVQWALKLADWMVAMTVDL